MKTITEQEYFELVKRVLILEAKLKEQEKQIDQAMELVQSLT